MNSGTEVGAPRSFLEFRSPEVRDLAKKTQVALVFVAQTAQAGLHLPVGSRYFLAEEIGRRIVRRLAVNGHTAIVGAVLPFGHSGYNAGYPGVIQLSPETLATVIVEIGECLAGQGFNNLVILSNAGGNPPSIKLALHRLAALNNVRAFFLDLQRVRPLATRGCLESAHPEHDSHAGESETSCMLAIAPHLVDMARAECWYPDPNDDRHKLPFEGLPFHDRQLALGVADNRGWIGPSGIIGDATRATAQKGHFILDNYARLMADHIRKWVFEEPAEVARRGRSADDLRLPIEAPN
jgi:creatinine amidohydrolase